MQYRTDLAVERAREWEGAAGVRTRSARVGCLTRSEVVQVIGGVMVLYRLNPKLHEKKKIPVKKASPEKKRYDRVQLKKKSPFEDKKGRDKRIVKKAK